MSLKVLSMNDRNWDTIVKSFKSYDVYYLSGYVEAFQMHGDGEPLLFYYEDEILKGMHVVMKRDISNDSYFKDKLQRNALFDLITPYGYGGWIFEGKKSDKMLIDSSKIFRNYEMWCRNNNVISEFVRFHPLLNNYKYCQSYYDIDFLGKTIAMDLDSKEIIFKNLTSKNRNVIRKAKKNGIEIEYGDTLDLYLEFKELYDLTMRNISAEDYYFFNTSFYESLYKSFRDNSQIFYAKKDKKIIAAAIILNANKNLHYHLSGSLKEYQKYAPTNLLLYVVAVWGHNLGYQSFHLGGGVGASEDSLYKFKQSFNRNRTNNFYIGKKIYNQREYERLMDLREELVNNTGFFPLYRA